jgi:hypothetical protein
LRRAIVTWGATAAEACSRLPGDELLEDADGVATRAIEIDAPASAVWPWIAQLGPSPRGGAYTYDWIENLLGLNMHSVDRVLAEFQHPEVGDTIGYGANKMRLEQRFSEKWIRAAWSEMNCHDWLVSRNVRHVGDGVRSGDERGRNAQSRLAVSGVEVQPLSMSDVENDRHRATR